MESLLWKTNRAGTPRTELDGFRLLAFRKPLCYPSMLCGMPESPCEHGVIFLSLLQKHLWIEKIGIFTSVPLLNSPHACSTSACGYPTERRRSLVEHLRFRYLTQPPEQMGGVNETIANYLNNFLTPDIAQVFCPSKNTFDFADIDRGKIICVAMPQKFQTERRYVNTFLKMLFYTRLAPLRPTETTTPGPQPADLVG
jgi:hypothetical protein